MASKPNKKNVRTTHQGVASSSKATGPTSRRHFRWTAQRIQQLGQVPDRTLAERWKIGTTSVYKKRNELGIAPFGRSNKTETFRWTKRDLNRLGKESDYKIANRLGLSVSTVASKRKQLQIPSFQQQQGRRLGRQPRKWKPAELKLLGKHPDAWVAAKLKMGRRHVYAKRLELGIPSLTEQKASKMWTEKRKRMLGQVPDREIAEQIGVTVATVSNYRKSLGIDSFRDQNRSRVSNASHKAKQRQKVAPASIKKSRTTTARKPLAAADPQDSQAPTRKPRKGK